MDYDDLTPERRPFTEKDLFSFTNDPYGPDYRKGIECLECGAAVIYVDKHVEWHNKLAGL